MKIDYINELIKIKDDKKTYCDEWLQQKEKLVLYGAGKLGKLAIAVLKKINLYPEYIVDKNIKGKLDGIDVISPKEIPEEDKKNKLFLICISTIPYQEIYMFLQQIGVKRIRQFYTYATYNAPEVLGNGWIILKKEFDLNKAAEICTLLSHCDMSVAHYLQFLYWKVNNKEYIYKDYPVLSGKKYFFSPVMPLLTDRESFLDCGCYQGAIIESFIQITNGKYAGIYAVEPDKNSMKIVQNKYNDKRIIFDNCGLSDKIMKDVSFQSGMGYASKISEKGNEFIDVKTIDELNFKPSIIKIHTEGEELKILNGATHIIKKLRPIMMILADHSMDGFYMIPNFARKLENYKCYFCLHDYCGNSAVYYFVPRERKD